jgi:hypothetical protein
LLVDQLSLGQRQIVNISSLFGPAIFRSKEDVVSSGFYQLFADGVTLQGLLLVLENFNNSSKSSKPLT